MFLSVKGCKLWVQVHTPPRQQQQQPHKDWVLLMHGYPDTSELWREQVAALTAAGHTCITPDMPGFGRSAFLQPDELSRYSLRSIVGVMCGMLDELGLSGQQVAVVGHDWGAAVAWAFAQQAPQRLSKLVVLSVGHPGGAAAVDARQRAHWWYQLFFCLPGAEAAVTAHDWALFRQIMGSSCSQQQLDAYVQQLARPGALTSALSWYRANTHARHFGATTPLPAATNSLVTVPVLGVWSTRDSALLEPQMLASSRYVAPGLWQYARLEGVGHWMARDAPQQLNKLLLDFLGLQPPLRSAL